MSTEYLHETARMIREKATHPDLSGGPWFASPHGDVHDDGSLWVCDTQSGEAAEHIASWHPAVALAVADWLDSIAAWPMIDQYVRDYFTGAAPGTAKAALAVARAWRGEL